MLCDCVFVLQLLTAAMQEFNAVAKGNVSDADLARAKLASYLLPPSSCTHTHAHTLMTYPLLSALQEPAEG